MSTHPQTPRGSDPDVAEGGLDVEASFAELDEATSRRLSMEAQSQKGDATNGAETEGVPGSLPGGEAGGEAGGEPRQGLPHEGNLPRQPNGPSAVEMLGSPVDRQPETATES